MYKRFLRFLLVACWTHKFNVLINVYDRLMMKWLDPFAKAWLYFFFSPSNYSYFTYLFIYFFTVFGFGFALVVEFVPFNLRPENLYSWKITGDDRSIERIQWNYCLWLPVIVSRVRRTLIAIYQYFFTRYEIVHQANPLLTGRRDLKRMQLFSFLGEGIENLNKFVWFSNWLSRISCTKKKEDNPRSCSSWTILSNGTSSILYRYYLL